MRTKRGVESGSVPIYRFSEDQAVSDGFLNQVRLNSAMIRLWVRVVGHSHLAGVSQAVGKSMRVGIIIFSIVVSLGFGGGRIHGCGLWLLVVPDLRLLHRRKMLVKALAPLKN